MFRDVVLTREEMRRVGYEGQRDHSAHTVNNYLLGWYFWTHCPTLKAHLSSAITNRRCNGAAMFANPEDFFGFLWIYVSLLHDVGYMLEGAAAALEPSNNLVEIGVSHIREYFENEVWKEHGLSVPSDRNQFLINLGQGLEPPRFAPNMSLPSIANALRDLGDLSQLCDKIAGSFAKAVNAPGNDTFSVWQHQYDFFGQSAAVRRTESLERIFWALLTRGLPRMGIRILDHGVCSGLLQFLVSTYYYRAKAAADASQNKHAAVNNFKTLRWEPAIWWSGIAWATCATALHNVQVMDTEELTALDPHWPGRLTVEEEPLAYLGVLVDVLQEWDRYPVYPRRELEPIQGHEVELKPDHGRIRVRFGGKTSSNRKKKVLKELDRSLQGWDEFVTLED